MVVVSGWAKNFTTYPLSVENEIDIANENQTMAAKAILICRPNSHHFQERTLILDQPVKVGRSLGRPKPTPNNAIFDCKVLSRHHALLWYENGKFYLQDTKSSNGTFVNNNRLVAETENCEVSSGDIVQFGVDVVENNRKISHGCIIATLKLYLPDGKEAKASPSITDSGGHGLVPLDDLYKLNQILQEASQREQCLETKLAALQHVVDVTKRSAEESWQAYLGEERLLSRLSALETQLQQTSKNWSEDRLKEEIAKLRETNEQYQEAAKEALEKVHSEKLEAVSMAIEQERAKISAEQDSLLAKDQLEQAQLELQEVAQKLSETQLQAEQDRLRHEQEIQELERKLEEEEHKVLQLSMKLSELELQMVRNIDFEQQSKFIYRDDIKNKEDILGENDMTESIMNMSNTENIEPNHISLTVAPVEEKSESEKPEDCEPEKENKPNTTVVSESRDEGKKVHFKLPEDEESNNDAKKESLNGHDQDVAIVQKDEEEDKDNYSSDHVDSKTLKYQFQSAQNEWKRKIEMLESMSSANKHKIIELDKALHDEKEISDSRLRENEKLKEELCNMEQIWKESCNESQQLKDRVTDLARELVEAKDEIRRVKEEEKKKPEETDNKTISSTNSVVTYEQLINLEEELVMLKERFAQITEDKIKVQRELVKMTDQYNMVCNSSYNKHFFYVAPLVLMVLYLLISAMVS